MITYTPAIVAQFEPMLSNGARDVMRTALLWREIKVAPAPNVPGATEFERFDNAIRKMFTFSKNTYLKEEARLKRTRAGMRAGKRPA
jgi:hypothetical protein